MKIYQVGGSIRDKILNINPDDIDYVVTNSSISEMLSLGFEQVGKDFPVFLKDGNEYALARKEKQNGNLHNSYSFDLNTTIEEDLQRRDFTCNSIALDLDTNKYIDPFNGIEDIRNKILRITDFNHFMEDPLRILRFSRFKAKLNFTSDINSLEYIKKMVLNGSLKNLTPERIFKEIEKMLSYGYNFDIFIRSLEETGALSFILPEINNLIDHKENELYHQEGNTFEHTLLVIKKAQEYKLPSEFVFACLTHDIGKPISVLHHESEGLTLINQLCNRLRFPNSYRKIANLFCKFHMKFHRFKICRPSTIFDLIYNLSDKFKNSDKFNKFLQCSVCDSRGRVSVDKFNEIEFINFWLKCFDFLKNQPFSNYQYLLKYPEKDRFNLYRSTVCNKLGEFIKIIRK